MTDLEKIEAFLARNRRGYETLVREIRTVCKQVAKTTGAGAISRVYSRGTKTDEDEDELKAPVKVLEKLDPPIDGDDTIAELHDIIGVTVVVYYADDTSRVFNAIVERLEQLSITCHWEDEYSQGYFAKHAAFRSTQGDHSNLRCELQIKTILHDAWSAKMHDLTYKPAGAMDARLGGLMGAVASQIQGIELQSQTIRNIVVGRHKLENRAFQAYCDAVFDLVFSLGNSGTPTKAVTEGGSAETRAELLDLKTPPFSDLWQRIEQLRSDAAQGRPDLEAVQRIVDQVDALCATPPNVRAGWLLIARLASGYVFGNRSGDLAVQVDRLLRYAKNHPEDEALSPIVLQAVPLAFYVVGDLQRAAQYTERLAKGQLSGRLSPQETAGFEFNRLSYLLEFEQLKPTRSKVRRERLKSEIEAALADPHLHEKEALASNIQDTEGLFQIVFGETGAEVKKGISLCTQSAANPAPGEKVIAEACLEWRLEAGWRRYFDLADRNSG